MITRVEDMGILMWIGPVVMLAILAVGLFAETHSIWTTYKARKLENTK